jgi:hypothetical protein
MVSPLRPALHGVLSRAQLALVAALLALAWLSPLPLYLVALALFGLPHVIWELGYLRSRYGARWPRRWWMLLGAGLMLEGATRAAYWLGWLKPLAAQIGDLLVLALLGLAVVAAPRGAGGRTRLAGGAFAIAVYALLQQGEILLSLLLLSIAHNFTPVVLAWDQARGDARARPLAWTVTGLFLLPLVLVLLGASAIAPSGDWLPAQVPDLWAAQQPLLDGQLPQGWSTPSRAALLSALVLSQCLHYFCVIRLLPQAQAHLSGQEVLSAKGRAACAAAVVVLLGYYLVDLQGARKLYAVASGMHAWLEWPLLLMAWTAPAAMHREAQAE